ncbi:MAG: Na+/H+ antiporter [Nocardioidaceae bacterium]
MHLALTLASLTALVIAIAGVSRRFGLPAPLVLVGLGAIASFLPFVPQVHLSAELALVGFLPPLLYATALKTSLVDFNKHRRAILLLSVGLVAFTALGVGLAVHAVLPGVSWPAAFALGAVVSPPDAVAATAVARRVGMPRRLVTVLEGESLVNDATALVALRTAVGAAVGTVSVLNITVDFVRAAGVGIAVGLAAYVVVGWVRRHVVDPVLDTSVSLVTPFLAYVLAELAHASGVLAVVVAGLLLGHRSPVLQTASSRIAERLNWRTIAFLLENTVFVLIGLQARWIVADVADSGVSAQTVVVTCAVTLLAVMGLRLVWVFPARYVLLGAAPDENGQRPSWRYTAVIGWAGMRGVVTLAAAFAIPTAMDYRELLVLVALVVAAGTLFIQGLTLPWLVRVLRLPAPDPREDALARAALFDQATEAGLAVLDRHADEEDPYGTVEEIRRRARQRDTAAWERLGSTHPDEETPSEAYAKLRLEMLQVERETVLKVRSSGRLPHEVIEDVLASLDVEESMLDVHNERAEDEREASEVIGHVGITQLCEHLRDAPTDTEPDVVGECEDCVREGFTSWVHLRMCLACGHVGCCDSSPRHHATSHFEQTGHPVIRSAEPHEAWRWCFVDSRLG